ncbi:MAG: hypothetical protein JKY55_07020 [Aliivibrio sp.]|uniref:hypothetical protein n=1 Tax=Aliivibrio sp. TaxID=1872443 RepID=UPI001A469EF4|nr:hypothetical protein [Aliivibrio sp.]
MKIKQVPQDHISTYADNSKAIYATDDNGEYSVVASTGWNVEEEATKQALNELERQATEAYKAVEAGEQSPLYYHMYAQRMDVMLLAQSVGMFQWRVKRHLKPAVFASLSDVILARYCDALGIEFRTIKQLPNKISLTQHTEIKEF